MTSSLFLSRPEGRLAYDVAGTGPLVVCSPAMGELRASYRHLVPLLVDRYLAGDIDVDSFLSHRITLDDVNRGFDLMHHQDGIRSVIAYS